MVQKLDTMVQKIDAMVQKINTMIQKISVMVQNINTMVQKISIMVQKINIMVQKINTIYKYKEGWINSMQEIAQLYQLWWDEVIGAAGQLYFWRQGKDTEWHLTVLGFEFWSLEYVSSLFDNGWSQTIQGNCPLYHGSPSASFVLTRVCNDAKIIGESEAFRRWNTY